jgi:oxygen-dependent protoporphyrinogen oxidase
VIVIVGAGISGLAAAHELAGRRVPFTVLEASARAGGLIVTEQRGGFTIDAGADSMLASKPAARALCDEAGLSTALQQMVEPRSAYVLDRGRLFPLPSPSVLGVPLTAAGALGFSLLPPAARLRLLLEPFAPRREQPDESVASFFRRRFGAATVGRVAQPLLGGIHAGDVEELSIASLFPALRDAEASGSVVRALKRRTAAPGGTFVSIDGGMGRLPRAIADALPAESIRYGIEVRGISGAPGDWRVGTSAGSERARTVILATPVHTTARLLETIDPRAAALCAAIPHASTVSVVFAWRRDAIAHPLRGSGFVVARTRQGAAPRITAATWTSSKWEGRAPAGYALLRAFIGGTRDADAIELPDDELARVASRSLADILGISGPPALTRVYRWRDASPQLNVGHGDRIRRVTQYLQERPGIFVTGRGFQAVGIPDCIADARSAAAAAAAHAGRMEREHR